MLPNSVLPTYQLLGKTPSRMFSKNLFQLGKYLGTKQGELSPDLQLGSSSRAADCSSRKTCLSFAGPQHATVHLEGEFDVDLGKECCWLKCVERTG